MIGVIARADQIAVVEEFFELFKTPWEFYRSERRYDVILATTEKIPEVDVKLLVLYGSSTQAFDASIGIVRRAQHSGTVLRHEEILVPIYGDLVTFVDGPGVVSCLSAGSETAGLKVSWRGRTVKRFGYDLFDEVKFLLSVGQPVEHASAPTLEIHITILRNSILSEGIPLVEIPPVPAGHSMIVCLTHDIDFVGIRNHRFDHTMWGFLYRSTVGSIQKFLRARISTTRLVQNWKAVASLPFVYLGWLKDFWEPFGWYLQVEKGLETTYFLIPFKGRAGERVQGRYSSRRAAAYDVDELSGSIAMLRRAGCEVAVHGIDAWHSIEKGERELGKIAGISGETAIGIRMHWLLQDQNTTSVLDQAGYAYDSSGGYNEAIGYRYGTTQVFRPLNAKKLLEVSVNIQDGALFYPKRMDLSEQTAKQRCLELVKSVTEFGGVLTLIWHDRSHGPERFWGDFYMQFVDALKSCGAWFATMGRAVSWFRKRREVRFEQVQSEAGTFRTMFHYQGSEIQPPLKIRIHNPATGRDLQLHDDAKADFFDISWNGSCGDEFEALMREIASCTGSRSHLSVEDDKSSERKGVPACSQ